MRKIALILSLLLIPSFASADIIPSSRRITWQGNVGVPGGIPNRTTICATINASTYGNDSTDARSAINNALSSCPSNQVVYLPPGTYRVSGTITIPSGRVLRGAGPSSTVIRFSGSAGTGSIITMGGTGGVGTGVNITSGYTKDSTQLVLSSASGKDVGDLIWIDQLNDGDLVTNQGIGSGGCNWCGRLNGTRSMAQISIITAKSGNTVTIDPPMQYTYTSGLDPEVAEISGVSTNVGLEDLKVQNSPGNAGLNVQIYGNKYSWIKNIESDRPYKYPTYSCSSSNYCFHVRMQYGFRNEIRDSYLHHNTQTGSNSYVIQMVYGSSYCLIENNRFSDAKAYVYAGWGSSAMVAGYNYVHDFQNDANYYSGDISGHGAHPKFFLLEGNFGQKFRWDNYWGSSSHNTGFRNYYRATQPPGSQQFTANRNPIDVDYDNPYFNLVGNVLGQLDQTWVAYETTQSDCGYRYIYILGWGGEGCKGGWQSEIRSTMLRHGNYDAYTDTTKWCDDSGEPGCQSGDASRTIPNSLYLSGKPDWWCDELPWPPIGSDLSPMVSDIPAKRRYEGLSCTTGGVDTTPNQFTFTDVTGATTNTLYTSNTITVGGINSASAISISGNSGQYQKNGGSWTSSSGTVVNGDTVAVRQTSSGSDGLPVSTTLVIGGVSDTYTVTTAGGAETNAPAISNRIPPSGGTGVVVSDRTVSFTLTDETAVDSSTVRFNINSEAQQGCSTGLTCSPSGDPTSLNVTYTRGSNWGYSTTYSANVSADDTLGNHLGTSWSFTTQSSVPSDQTAPTLGTHTPNTGETSWAYNNPYIDFDITDDTAVDDTTLLFHLDNYSDHACGTIFVTCTWNTNPTSLHVRYTYMLNSVAADWEYGSSHTAYITQVQDTSGNTLSTSWTFTVESATVSPPTDFTIHVEEP